MKQLILEQATIQTDSEKNYNYCVYDSDISTGMGVGAFLFLLAGQVLIMLASRCFCCGKPLSPGGSRAWAVILFIICWYVRISSDWIAFYWTRLDRFGQILYIYMLILAI